LGIITYYQGSNEYGYFPGQNKILNSDGTFWRISIFPNVVDSSFFSFIVFFLNIYDWRNRNIAALLSSLYFFLFSGQRTLIVILLVIILFGLISSFIKFERRRFYYLFPYFIVISFIFITAASSLLLAIGNTGNSALNQYLFRSEDGFTNEEQVSTSLARVIIWQEHLSIYLNNPIFGLGTYNFQDVTKNFFNEQSLGTGSESFLTGLLSRIGVLIGFIVYFFHLLIDRAIKNRNKFLCQFVPKKKKKFLQLLPLRSTFIHRSKI
jgi:O-antigen ligase